VNLQKRLVFLGRHLARRNPWAVQRAERLIAGERLAPEHKREYQARLLRATLARARRRLPAHAGLAPLPAHEDPFAWLAAHVPVIDKADLIAGRAGLYPNGGRRRPWWPSGKTSGTSGAPLEVFRSLDSVVWEEAFQMQAWAWAGFRLGEPQAVLRGDTIIPLAQARPPFWLWDGAGRQLFVSSRHLSPATAGAMLDAIAAAGVTMLRAYPSTGYELARLAERLSHGLRLRAVVTGSEPLFPVQREQIERAFGCRVFDFYGMAERIAYAAQCEHGGYHLNTDYSHVEILDDAGRPTRDFGSVVGTTLRNHVMPLLRYRVADRARWLDQVCPCGRSYPLIELSSGKVEDQLYDWDGTPVSASIVTFAFKGLAHIRQSQVAQVAQDRWLVRVMPDTGYSEADSASLRRNIAEHVTPRIHVEVQLVDEIARLASGKFKWVSQEWPQAHA